MKKTRKSKFMSNFYWCGIQGALFPYKATKTAKFMAKNNFYMAAKILDKFSMD